MVKEGEGRRKKRDEGRKWEEVIGKRHEEQDIGDKESYMSIWCQRLTWRDVTLPEGNKSSPCAGCKENDEYFKEEVTHEKKHE